MVKFFESENENDLANSILQLWRDPELREHLVAGATQYVKQNSWQVRKQEYLSLVDHLGAPTAVAHDVASKC
jgi:glycosyltransferase involved in cell wall biosynthesis